MGSHGLYVKGVIYYYDVFGRPHETEFCFSARGAKLMTNTNAMSACEQHNSLD